jgi:3-hydroxybutyryl-CoA dehydrogenase
MSIAHGIKRLGVLGAGQMGTGIAFVSALHAKVPVLLHDKSAHQISKGLSLIDKLLAKDVSKGRLQPSDAEEARARIQTVDALEAMRDVDMVVEAVTENLDLKRAIFRDFAAKIRPDAILATNTSSISITKIARAVIPEGASATGEEGKAASGRVVGECSGWCIGGD